MSVDMHVRILQLLGDLDARVSELADRVAVMEFGEDEIEEEEDEDVAEAEEMFDDHYAEDELEPREAFVLGYLEGIMVE